MLCLENLIMIMASNKFAFFNSGKDISAFWQVMSKVSVKAWYI